MNYDVKTVNEYIEAVSKDRRQAFIKLVETIESSLPNGYHAKKGEPLPFISVANQKNHFAIYHTGIYMNQKLRNWLIGEYKKRVKTKLEMSKSCIRLKYFKDIPYELISELCQKISVNDFIIMYENTRK